LLIPLTVNIILLPAVTLAGPVMVVVMSLLGTIVVPPPGILAVLLPGVVSRVVGLKPLTVGLMFVNVGGAVTVKM
jgi:hypothetical protein